LKAIAGLEPKKQRQVSKHQRIQSSPTCCGCIKM